MPPKGCRRDGYLRVAKPRLRVAKIKWTADGCPRETGLSKLASLVTVAIDFLKMTSNSIVLNMNIMSFFIKENIVERWYNDGVGIRK